MGTHSTIQPKSKNRLTVEMLLLVMDQKLKTTKGSQLLSMTEVILIQSLMKKTSFKVNNIFLINWLSKRYEIRGEPLQRFQGSQALIASVSHYLKVFYTYVKTNMIVSIKNFTNLMLY